MAPGPVHLRTAEFTDHAAVQELMREAGFKRRSREGWDWLFSENPALETDPGAPIGWILEQGSDIVGYLANIPMAYACGPENYSGRTCSGLYVRNHVRSESIKLMSAFFRQKGVHFFLTTTANDASRPLYELFKAVSPPDRSFFTDYAWVADVDALLHHGAERYLGRRQTAACLAAVAAPFARLGLRLAGRDLRKRKRNSRIEITAVRAHDVGSLFDDFWEAQRCNDHLIARRCSRTLRWHMSDPDRGSDPHLLAAIGPHGIEGYALGARHQPEPSSLPRFNVFDLALRAEADTETLAALLAGAAEVAEAERAGLLVLAGYSRHVADQLSDLRPFDRRRAISSAYIRAINPKIAAAATVPDFWRATPLDGDRGLAIRDVTRTAHAA